jgi:hypothetical protein
VPIALGSEAGTLLLQKSIERHALSPSYGSLERVRRRRLKVRVKPALWLHPHSVFEPWLIRVCVSTANSLQSAICRKDSGVLPF